MQQTPKIKSSLFPSMELALFDMILSGTLCIILMRSFHLFSRLDAFMGALVEVVLRHPAVGQNPAEIIGRTTERKIEDIVGKNDNELNYPLQ